MGKILLLTHATEESETGRNGNAPHDVLHQSVQEGGMQERDEKGLKKKENPTRVRGMPKTESQPMTQRVICVSSQRGWSPF